MPVVLLPKVTEIIGFCRSSVAEATRIPAVPLATRFLTTTGVGSVALIVPAISVAQLVVVDLDLECAHGGFHVVQRAHDGVPTRT